MLYIVATAIGNIEDTSLRAIKTLVTSNIILAEDTLTFDSYYKRIQKLFSMVPQKKQKIVHFHKENEFEKIPWVIDQLETNMIISLVSESGLPTIADPGGLLIHRLITNNVNFTVIPGSSALTTAMAYSGSIQNNIIFLGFLPKKKAHVLQSFKRLKACISKYNNLSVIFYESPHRIQETLKIIDEVLPQAEITICREMTKKFEEIIRGTPGKLADKNIKGEITVVMHIKH